MKQCDNDYESVINSIDVPDKEIYEYFQFQYRYGDNFDKFYAGRILKEFYKDDIPNDFFDQFESIKDDLIWPE